MQPIETTFLYELNLAQTNYVNNYIKRVQVGQVDQQVLEKVKVILLESFVEILEYWYRDTYYKDDNFFTFAEIQDILQGANDIMGTTIRIDYPTTLTMEDYDGNIYRVVRIGDQEWMAENLEVLHYRDGTPIPNLTDATEFFNDTTGAYCWYDNDIINKDTYGALYNWYAVVNVHNLAPEGWRIPTVADFGDLVTYIGGVDACGALKEVTTNYWNYPNWQATDLYGFRGTGAGNRFIDTPFPSDPGFDKLKVFGDFFTNEEVFGDPTSCYSYYLDYNDNDITQGNFRKSCGQNVRCVRNVV